MNPVALVVSALLLASGTPQAQQRVNVPSLDQAQGEAVRLPGFWFPANGLTSAPGPRPAFVLLHGCGGPYAADGRTLSLRMREYAALLNGWGVHVLVTDSLTPRGERELCTQKTAGRRVTQQERRRDALGALQWLAAQPGVDAARLGLLGWSHGGSNVLAATHARHPEVANAPVRPALAVAYYPGCAAELKAGWSAVAPLLLLVGEADDWTPPGPCRELAARATRAGEPVQFHAYPGAHHGFDGREPVRLRRDVPNGVKPGAGVHVGGDPLARADSRVRLREFFAAQGFGSGDPAQVSSPKVP